MTRRALITGAGGFVGRYLGEHLTAQGWEVAAAGDRPAPGLIPFDVTRPDSIASMLDAAGPLTHVFHLAAVTFVPDANRDPAAAMAVNLNGTIQLLAALQVKRFSGRFLFVGSADAYGRPQFLPITETHPLNPANPYAISKAAADHYCAWFAEAAAMDIVRMRPFNHSGPGQQDQFVLSSFARQIAELEAGGGGALRTGNLDVSRDFLHVRDVVRAYECAALHGKPGAVYNVCSGVARPLRGALATMLEWCGAPIAVEADPARMRPVDVPEFAGAHALLTEETGWRPEIPFDDLLRELLEYWRGRIVQGAPA